MTGILTHSYEVDAKAKARLSVYDASLQAVKWIEKRMPDWKAYADRLVAVLQDRTPGYDWVGFYQTRADDLVLIASAGADESAPRLVEIRRGTVGRAAGSGTSITKTSTGTFRSEIATPVRRFGVIIGVISVKSRERASFTLEDTEFLEKVSHVAGSRFHGGPL